MRTCTFRLNPLRCFGLALPVALAAALLPATAFATDLLWTNSGVITTPPQIDAVNFLNTGTMSLFSALPFETSNTRNFTNSGTMQSSPGFYFSRAASTEGARQMADNFVNLAGGTVQALDPGRAIVIGGGGGVVVGGVTPPPSYLWIHATNIINKGMISVGANGWMRLAGTNIDLKRSGVQVTSIVPIGSSNAETNFTPDAGIYDLYWNQTNIAAPPGMIATGIWQATGPLVFAQTPPHQAIRPGTLGRPGGAGFVVLNPFADTYTTTNGTITVTVTNFPPTFTNITGTTVVISNLANIVSSDIEIPTNITRQAVFVSVSDTNVQQVGVQWFPSSSPTNFFATPEVSINTIATNVVTATPELNSLYLYDTLAAETNRGILRNVTAAQNADTFRPNPYVLSRIPMMGLGAVGNGYPAPDFLFTRTPEMQFTNAPVASEYAAYSAFIDNLPSEPPNVPGGTVTNLPGRVQIYADNLDMTRTRVRGEGYIQIHTKNLAGSSNAIVDAQNLSFNLATTHENLNFVNLAAEQVARTKGNMYVWSGVWQNDASFIITNSWLVSVTNFAADGSNVVSVELTNAPVTNALTVGLYALLVNGDSLLSVLPVSVWDFESHSKELTINDRISVVQSFLTDAERMTINGRLTFSNASWLTAVGTTYFASMADWGATNAPNLSYFTNNGIMVVPNREHFGDDRLTPYAAWVNTGSNQTSSLSVTSDYFEDRGLLDIYGPIELKLGTGNFVGGLTVATLTEISANNLHFDNNLLSADSIRLSVSGALTDPGVTSSNAIFVQHGFHLLTKPESGDLLGTTLQTGLADFIQTDHTWAGVDRGASPAGYVNNAAVGSLVIGPVGRDPLAYFKGAKPGSALYVDFIDLAELGENWAEWIEIDPSFTIYYATARLGFTPPANPDGTIPTAEQYLDGKLGGRLKWVSSYPGGRSSVVVMVGTNIVFMNVALRISQTEDSDGDGVPNYFDPTPLGDKLPAPAPPGAMLLQPAMLHNPGSSMPSFSMSWIGQPQTTYCVEIATDLVKPDWQVYKYITNSESAAKSLSFSDDVNSSTVGRRFYRVTTKK